MIFVLILELLCLKIISGNKCDDILCSNVFDYVCGKIKYEGSIDISKYQNICHLEKERCYLNGIANVSQVPHDLCGLEKDRQSGRRLHDFTIVGSYTTCNHSCPVYCIDAYDPVCVQIFKRHTISYQYKMMINHCHVDLISCALGVNVTTQPVTMCYSNGNHMIFMKQVAALNSLKVLSRRFEGPDSSEYYKISRGSLSEEQEAVKLPTLSDQIKEILNIIGV